MPDIILLLTGAVHSITSDDRKRIENLSRKPGTVEIFPINNEEGR